MRFHAMLKFVLILLLSTVIQGSAQTTVAPVLTSNPQFFDNNGNPLAGGCVFTYSAGTTTPLVTYSESTGTTPNSNPVILNSAGFPQSGGIWLSSAAYKIKVMSAGGVNCASGSVITTTDNLTWATPLTTFSGITSTGNTIIKPAVAATGGANQSSPTLCIDSFYFNITSLTDAWCLQAALGAGASPTSTFSVTHSGSGGTAAINLPVGLQLNFVQSTLANAASSGFERLATTDQECWRNAANGGNACLLDPGGATAATGNLADLMKYTGGGAQFAAYVDQNANPAQSGVLRTGNNVCAVASRNAAANADVCAVLVDGSNITNLGGAAGVKFVSVGSTLTMSKQIFTANGTFTIPAGVTAVKVTVVGAGGAGGGGNAAGSGNGGGGAAGGSGIKWLSGLTPGNTLAVTVGTGGTGASGTTGNAGTSSSVASGTQTISTITANGGVGGSAGAGVANASGAIETAAGTGGDINLGGAGGGFAFSSGPYGGPGGNSIFGGAGGNTASAGRAATGLGSGGSGAASNATQVGGAGAGGVVIFEWVQ